MLLSHPEREKKALEPYLQVMEVRWVNLSHQLDSDLTRHRLVSVLVGARVHLAVLLLVWVQLLGGVHDAMEREGRKGRRK